MANVIPILSASTIKSMIPHINNEIDNDLINQITIMQQTTTLRFSMTTDFYEDMYKKFTGNTMSTAYTYLKENYLDWILAFAVWQNIVLTQSYHLNSAGLRIKTTDHSTAAEFQDIDMMKNYIQTFIDNKRREMEEFIEDNQGDYPLYYQDSHGEIPVINKWRIGKAGYDTEQWEDENRNGHGYDY